MKWFAANWQFYAWIIGGLATGLVFAESEYRTYINMKEAVKEQKEFNEKIDDRMNKIDMQQQRIDERTELMLDYLKKLTK